MSGGLADADPGKLGAGDALHVSLALANLVT
jgi:hypothetical protein